MADVSTTQQLQEMLNRLAAGDAAAKKDLINRSYERLTIITRKLLGSFLRVRAEEETTGVLNEAYLRLHTALDEIRPTTVRQFMGLAALEIRRVLLDYVRKLDGRGRKARPGKVSLNDRQSGGEGETLGFDIVDTDVDEPQRTLALDLLESIGKLPDEEREVVELLFFHGYTQPEAGDILGVHEDTVKRRWAKARVKLAKLLAAFEIGV
jgi:RNA polymerase sigma factor (TIGR02999 family)